MHSADPRLAVVGCAEEQRWHEALLEQPVREPQLRLWTYRSPGVVFGCSQAALLARARRGAARCELAQRRSGGGAVLTGPWMLSTSILLPPDHRLLAGGTVTSYRWLGALIAGLLRDMNVPAHALAPDEVRRAPDDPALDWACFGGLSPWEVVVGRRKIVGRAQLRRRNGVLLTSGTVLARPDWEALCAVVDRPAADARALAGATTSCEEQLGAAPLVESFASELHQMLTDVLGELPNCAAMASPSRRSTHA
ncbi:lipoate--protein ligase family protein [Denitromonas sp.]|uniref:lipoate--protein ligase family protein n=1 Tax=Denitromonas sp. TaxID=2734609 RepID=UPI003A8C7597